ncbi:NADH dehydrogenase [ubiquinone] 1 beta subcomplex subunit 6-like [Glandiceps talaboti]
MSKRSLQEIPEYAKGDYVLEKIAKEARQTKRNWLADQVLARDEPRIPVKKAFTEPIRRLIAPIDSRLNYALTRGFYFGRRWFFLFVLPVWGSHYCIKYHVANKPGALVMSKSPVFPGEAELDETRVR